MWDMLYGKCASHAIGVKSLRWLGFTRYIVTGLVVYLVSIASVCVAETLSEESEISANTIGRWAFFVVVFVLSKVGLFWDSLAFSLIKCEEMRKNAF